jgi:hypothetical protein
VLMAYAQQGTKGQRAGEEFMRLINRLTGAMSNHKKAWDDLGLTVFDSRGKLRPIADIIGDLTNKTKHMSDAQRVATLEQLGFVQEAQNAIRPLLGQADAIRAYTEQVKNAGGAIDDLTARLMGSFSESMGKVSQKLNLLQQDVGQKLAEGIVDSDGKLVQFSGVIETLKEDVELAGPAIHDLAEGMTALGSVAVGTGGFLASRFLFGMNVIANYIVGTLNGAIGLLSGSVQVLTMSFSGLLTVLEKITSLGGLAENPVSRFFKNAAQSAADAARAVAKFSGQRLDMAGANFALEDMESQDPEQSGKTDAQKAAVRAALRNHGVKKPGTVDTTATTNAVAAGKAEAQKQAAFLRQFNAEVAKETLSAYDDAITKINALELRAHEVFGKNLPESVTRGLKALKVAAGQDEKLRQAKTQFGLLRDEDGFDDAALKRAHAMTEEWKAQANSIENTAEVRKGFAELAEKSGELEEGIFKKIVALRLKGIEDEAKEYESMWKTELEGYRQIESAAQGAAQGITSAFSNAFATIAVEGNTLRKFMTVLGRQIAGALLGGLAQYAGGKVAENIASAFEEHAKAIASGASALLGNPMAAAAAATHEAAAHAHEISALKWAGVAALAGAASQIATAGGMSGGGGGGGGGQASASGASDQGGDKLREAAKAGPAIVFEVHEFDPMNPRAQERLFMAQKEYAERYGGSVTVNRKVG